MIKKAGYIIIFSIAIALLGILALRGRYPIGPLVLLMTIIPIIGLVIAKRSIIRALPDLIFGAIDTGLLAIPALWGGTVFGVAGAIAGGVVGDALTDSIAGIFEGGIAEWLRKKGIESSREPVTTSLGKMAGCLFGSGLVLTIALLVGIRPDFG
jgi:hypothetical protein